MQNIKPATLLPAALVLSLSAAFAQERIEPTAESGSPSNTISSPVPGVPAPAVSPVAVETPAGSQTNSAAPPPTTGSTAATMDSGPKAAPLELFRPADDGVFRIRTEKPSILFIPRFKQRLNDIGAQIKMAEQKGFISPQDAQTFASRASLLLLQESEVSEKGFPKPVLDDLEKSITLLNSDLFAAMHKKNPIRPGLSEKEINDPNLIPAYSDPALQPRARQTSEPAKKP